MTPERRPGSRGPFDDAVNCLLVARAVVALPLMVCVVRATAGESDLGLAG
ncbi:hypothetical protein [Streptomyces fagopyri]